MKRKYPETYYDSLFNKLAKICMGEKYSEVSPIEKLPDQLLEHIFSFLSTNDICLTAAKVSKKWHKVSCSNRLWREECKRERIEFNSNPNIANNFFKNLYVQNRPTVLYMSVIQNHKPDLSLRKIQLKEETLLHSNKKHAVEKILCQTYQKYIPYYVLYSLKISKRDLSIIEATMYMKEKDDSLIKSLISPEASLDEIKKYVKYGSSICSEYFVSNGINEITATVTDIQYSEGIKNSFISAEHFFSQNAEKTENNLQCTIS